MTEPRKHTTGAIESTVAPSAKTAGQRRAELTALLSNRKDISVASMPQEVKDLVSMLEGVEVKLGDQTIDSVPTAGAWRSYMAGKAKDVQVFTCLDGFSGRVLFAKDGYQVSMKVSLSIAPSK